MVNEPEDQLPESEQPESNAMIHEIYRIPSLQQTEKEFDRFNNVFEVKIPTPPVIG